MPHARHVSEAEWPTEEQLTLPACRAHFEALGARYGVRQPRLAPFTSAGDVGLRDIERSRCEAVVLAHNGTLFVRRGAVDERRMAHAIRLALLATLLATLPRSVSFVAGVDTHDLGRCSDAAWPHRGGALGVVVDSALPSSWAGMQLLLPWHKNLWIEPIALARSDTPPRSHAYYGADPSGAAADDAADDAADARRTEGCVWRGHRGGNATWQALHHGGRASCAPDATDRECVVEWSASGLPGLNASFGKRPNIVDSGAGAAVPACILALDGFAYPGITPSALLQGSLALRVGGHRRTPTTGASDEDGATRTSEFVWFEPLLVDGVHYVRSDLDDLPAALARLRALGTRGRRRIAEAGRAAAHALFTPRSVACYARLVIEQFSQAQPRATAEARARAEAGHEWVPACSLLTTRFASQLCRTVREKGRW